MNGRCDRCARPIQPDPDYHDTIESLAWEVVGAAHDEFEDLRGSAAEGTALQRAIVELANELRGYHYEGDGCLDDDTEA